MGQVVDLVAWTVDFTLDARITTRTTTLVFEYWA